MRIAWYSNAPWVASGYGQQTALVTRFLAERGHALAVLCNYGLRGGRLGTDNGIAFYPAGYDKHSNDIVAAHAAHFRADLLVSLYDAWPLRFRSLETRWLAWTPVDHFEVPPPVARALAPAARVVAMAQSGQAALRRAGFSDAAFIPHAVDTREYYADERAGARSRLNLPLDRFIVGMIAANRSTTDRKSLIASLQAFDRFRKTARTPVTLYLHTEESGIENGQNLRALIDALDFESGQVVLCDQYQYALGFPVEYMRDAYNALDVLLNPSAGEGFGIPIIEAQACGTPAIVTDATAMSELVPDGCGLRISEFERVWSEQGAYQARAGWPAIYTALSDFYEETRAMSEGELVARRARCQENARDYDLVGVVGPAWEALLLSESQKASQSQPASAPERARASAEPDMPASERPSAPLSAPKRQSQPERQPKRQRAPASALARQSASAGKSQP